MTGLGHKHRAAFPASIAGTDARTCCVSNSRAVGMATIYPSWGFSGTCVFQNTTRRLPTVRRGEASRREPAGLCIRAVGAVPSSPSVTTGSNGSSASAPPAIVPLPPPELAPPPAAFVKAAATGASKASMSAAKTFLLGILGGAFIGFGSFLAISIGGACPGLVSSNPGLQKLVYGAFGLPFGLFLVLLCGAELFTGNTALLTAAVSEEKATMGQLSKNWVCSYLGNFVGSLLMVYLVACTGLLATAPAPLNIAIAKTSLTFGQAFSRGILCNWLVCAAVWMANACSSATGKAVAIFFPISAFVALGLEHSVANMFMVPLGIALGANVSFAQFLTSNLLPVTLGNTVAGVACMGLTYSLMYGKVGKDL